MGPLQPRVDGQAVIEGVMMRTAEAFAVAVRRPTGEVVVRRRTLPPPQARFWVGQLPLLRGLVGCFDAIFLGYLALHFSLLQGGDNGQLATADLGGQGRVRRPQGSGAAATFWTLLAVTSLAPAATVLLPATLDALCAQGWLQLAHAGWPILAKVGAQLLSATAQLSVLPAYVAVAAQLGPLRRLRGYHAAEHKVRGAWAANLRLTLMHVRRQPAHVVDCRLHFTAAFGAVATAVFFALAIVLPTVPPPVDVGAAGQLSLSSAGFWLRVVALVPAVALAHELRRWQATRARRVGHMSVLPHRSATLSEPDAAMLEVALAALRAVLSGEGADAQRGTPATGLVWRKLGGALPAAALPSPRAPESPSGGRFRRGQRLVQASRSQAEATCCTS